MNTKSLRGKWFFSIWRYYLDLLYYWPDQVIRSDTHFCVWGLNVIPARHSFVSIRASSLSGPLPSFFIKVESLSAKHQFKVYKIAKITNAVSHDNLPLKPAYSFFLRITPLSNLTIFLNSNLVSLYSNWHDLPLNLFSLSWLAESLTRWKNLWGARVTID